MRGSKHLTVVMVVAMLAVAMVPGTVGAASTDALHVGVTQDAGTGDATVTVTRNETAVENATVVVESSGNYAGNGTYATGANGTVDLPNPQERVNATFTVTEGNNTTSTSVVLVPLDESLDVSVEADDANDTVVATVTQYGDAVEGASVMVNGTDYADNGTYETDADGTVEVAEPTTTTNLTFVAMEGDLTAETTVAVEGDDLSVSAEVDDANDTVVATVTQDGEPVENASVQVNGTDYAGNGTYETDANGTVEVAEPTTTTNLTFVATADGLTAETTVAVETDDLNVSVSQDGNESVTITVTEDGEPVENASVAVDGNYTDAGEYETDANGTVDLISPLQTVTVDVTAEYDGLSAETTVTLQGEVAAEDPFGQLVSSFVERLKDTGSDGPLGQAVSDFVTENNPGNADDKRPDHAGPKNSDDADDDGDAPGNSANAKNGNGGGPPDHANNDKVSDEEDQESDDDETETADDSSDDDSSDDDSSDDDSSDDDSSDDDSSDDDSSDDDESNGNGNGGGPPDHANN
ncbi:MULTISPECIES: hypothetical protein [unclassified Haloferax]|uniref:hypothetical protein n=1 Tax=unclassified Haloferax TaxID=2625095 RepID=UPI002876565B|nr:MULTISPECIES: hypothetical protein [unclassified Haloferax]MDS0241330.1 hypothetical protein [Haloferax sp. S2CR25]MDS0444451.1 hypothetical protein [Haloferax sp. S2CR25-2]